MKERIKNILYTRWSEPRHCFFWLAMVSLACLVVMIVIASYGLASQVPGTFPIAIGFLLCFVGSSVAFVLSCIPPVRQLFAWLWRRWLFSLVGLVTFVALFYAVENWRGWRAWHNYRQPRMAKGERFELASRVPSMVPAEQNFFETPLWNDMHFYQKTNASGRGVEPDSQVVWSDTNWGDHVFFDVIGPKRGMYGDLNTWIRGQRLDLATWQAFYRGSNNVFISSDGTPTNYFPLANEPQAPAADVLLALSRFGENRRLLIDTASRPKARFWINYEAGWAALLPHLARMNHTVQYLGLHAEAAREAGDKETALADIQVSFRMIEAIRSEPIIISHLVRMRMLEYTLQPVWQGLADHTWTEAELMTFDAELRKLDFLADYHLAMRGERAFNLWLVDYVQEGQVVEAINLISCARATMNASHGPGLREEWERALTRGMLEVVPRGWFAQNKRSLCEVHDKYLLALVDQTNRVVSPSTVKKAERVIAARRIRAYDAFSPLLAPASLEAPEKFAHAQTVVDLARVACALERYRLAKGRFPETLETLAPSFIERLPHDVINGEPLKYRRTDDGQFILYSVGWDETDEGGKFAAIEKGAQAQDKGDWTWRYPGAD